MKSTKTRRNREVAVDPEATAMLRRHCEVMDEWAAVGPMVIPEDGFVFSLEPDCSVPMSAEFVSKRVAILEEHSGIGTKAKETRALEDEALWLYRQPAAPRRTGRGGPAPEGGMSYEGARVRAR